MTITRESRREHILNTARKLILERGLQATSMNLISREAGVAMGSIYALFPSKESLVNELYLESRDTLFKSIISPADSPEDPKEGFRCMFRQYIQTALNHPDIFLFVEQYHLSPLIQEAARIEPDFRFGSRRLTELIREGVLRDMDILVIDAMLLGSINQILSIHFSSHLVLNDQIIDTALEACWRAIARETGENSGNPKALP